MKNIAKLFILISSCMLISLLLASCQSSDGVLKYKKVKGGYTITELSDRNAESVSIPSEYKGKDVIAIEADAFYGSKLKEIYIPSTVTSVGEQAFAYCTRLEKVNVSDISSFASIEFSSAESNPLYYAHTLLEDGKEINTASIDAKSIGSYAFAGCESLSEININGAEKIGKGAFYDCASLASISISDTVEYIGAAAFSGCTSLTEISIPDSVSEMSHSVFSGCSALKTAELSESLSAIPDRAFLECSSLEKISLPSDTLTIGASAFASCSSLASIDIPKKVTEILDSAFFNCSSLADIKINEDSKLRSIGKSAFRGCYSLTNVSFENATLLNLIDESAFQFCSDLTSITIPSSLRKLGDHAFSGCDSLELYKQDGMGFIGNSTNNTLILVKCIDDITYARITSQTKFICSGAFERNQTVTEIFMLTHSQTDEGVINVGCNAFAFCPNLQKVTFPKSIESIGDCALMGCKALQTIRYSGNGTAWKSVTRGTNWTYGAGTSTITHST